MQIERKDFGGKVVIDFFSPEDLRHLLEIVSAGRANGTVMHDPTLSGQPAPSAEAESVQPSPEEGAKGSEEDLYSIKNFSV